MEKNENLLKLFIATVFHQNFDTRMCLYKSLAFIRGPLHRHSYFTAESTESCAEMGVLLLSEVSHYDLSFESLHSTAGSL